MSDSFGNLFENGDVSNTKLLKNFETIPDLFIITNFLAKRVSKVPIKVVKQSGRDAPNSELWQLIGSPNYYQSWKDLIRTDYAYYNILGNSYIYGIPALGFDGQITSLYNLPADNMGVVLSKDKDLPAWDNSVSNYVLNLNGQRYKLNKEDVLHSKFFNLRYDSGQWAYGMSKYIPGDKIKITRM